MTQCTARPSDTESPCAGLTRALSHMLLLCAGRSSSSRRASASSHGRQLGLTVLPMFIALAAATAGCGVVRKKPANLPPLIPLAVTVLQQGIPVPDAFVRLLPIDASMPWSCGATTDANGVATIKTIGEFTGVPEGAYKVLITKLETPKTTGNDPLNLSVPSRRQRTESVNLIDPRYGLPNVTPLEVHVAKGSPAASFDVGPPVRVPIEPPR